MALIQQPADPLTLTVGLYGSDQDDGMVRVTDFAKCMARIEAALLATERCLRNKKPALTYLVAGLREGSAICSVRAKKPRRGQDYREEIVQVARNTIRSLQGGDTRVDPRLDRTALQKFRRVGEVISPRSINNRQRRMVVDGTEVTTQFMLAVDEALSIKDVSFGSVSGTLEKIDVHGKNQFAIYPAISGHQVVCTFKDELLEKVKDAVKKTVTVYGSAHYATGTLFPVRIDVEDLEEHSLFGPAKPLDQLIGALSEMRGDSVSIVRKLRDEWRD